MKDPNWQRERRMRVHHNPYWSVYCDEVRLEDGKIHNYHSLMSTDSILVVPRLTSVEEENRYVLVRQYRYLQQRWSIEFPGGGSNDTEEVHKAAGRELLEETGCQALKLDFIGTFAPCVGIMSETCHVFVAEVDFVVQPSFDDWEIGEVLMCTAKEIDQHIKDGALWSGMSITAWTLARMMSQAV